jgi:uncharacterized glyoxalase superfamily protein PhnB
VPNLIVESPARAADLYAEVLGMEVVMDHGWIVTLAQKGKPSVQMSLMSQDATADVNPDLSIEVADVDAVYESVIEQGLEVVHPLTEETWGVRRFFFKDESGYVVNVLSHR